MTKTKKARSNAATLEQARERSLDGVSFYSDNTMFPGARQVSVYLLHGEENAIPAHDLATIAGFNGTRALRDAVERERRAGALILSGDAGYYLPSTDETQAEREIQRFVHRSDSRMASNRQAVRACKRWLRRRKRREIVGQRGLFDEA